MDLYRHLPYGCFSLSKKSISFPSCRNRRLSCRPGRPSIKASNRPSIAAFEPKKWPVSRIPGSSVCTIHAGLNTVLEALARGVPQVAIPITNDQPGIAARIADKKTGLFVPLKELTSARLSLLLDKVLNVRGVGRAMHRRLVAQSVPSSHQTRI